MSFESGLYAIAFGSISIETVIEAFTAAGVIISEDDAAVELDAIRAAGVSTVDAYTFRFSRIGMPVGLTRAQKRIIAGYIWASDDNATGAGNGQGVPAGPDFEGAILARQEAAGIE